MGKWVASFMGGFKKTKTTNTPQADPADKASVKTSSSKWKLWRSSHSAAAAAAAAAAAGEATATSSKTTETAVRVSDSSSDSLYMAAVATIAQTSARDFKLLRQEWAVSRIQTAFRAFLARRAFRALKALVRLQAIFRGQQVRKQAIVTLRYMHTLVRVQARVRAQSSRPSSEAATDELNLLDPIMQQDGGWCDSYGTIEQVRAKLHMKQQGAIKRERATKYSLSQQLRTNPVLNSTKTKAAKKKLDKNGSGWNCLEGLMAAKSSEARSTKQLRIASSQIAPVSKQRDYSSRSSSNSSEHDTVTIKRNNISTRISARPTLPSPKSRSASDAFSEFLCDESTTSNSSASTFGTPLSNKTLAEGRNARRSYMKLTESIKAKQRPSKMKDDSIDNLRFFKKSPLPKRMAKRNDDCDLYPPILI